MSNIISKFTVALYAIIFLGLFSIAPVYAQISGSPSTGGSSSITTQGCSDPFSSNYTSQACVKERIGASDLKVGEILVARDPNSLIIVAFRVFLGIVVAITVVRIVIIGIKIAGAREDADKIKEQFQALVWTIVGMVIALGAVGITYAVQNIVFGDTFDDKIIQCNDLPSTASAELKDRCNKTLDGGSGGTNNGGTNNTRRCTLADGSIIVINGNVCPI